MELTELDRFVETDGKFTAGLDGVWRVVRTGGLLPPS